MSKKPSLQDLQQHGPEKLLAMATIHVSDRYVDYQPIIAGKVAPGRDYARIRFDGGGAAWLDVDSGYLRSGRPPKRKKAGTS